MLLNDIQITELAQKGMISPFEPNLVRRIDDLSVISYGLSSFGYDIRLSSKEFKIFKHIPGTVINPKNFNPDNLESVPLQKDEWGEFFILPGHSYGLGVAVERLDLPRDITVVCLSKSTYARVAIAQCLSPGEAMWRGHLTLELANHCAADCRVYANEGVAQLQFFRGEPCAVSYADRKGKYQDQPEQVVLARA